MAKTYTDRSNCIRAAKAALGKDAQMGVAFILAGEKGAYSWAPVAPQAPEPAIIEPVVIKAAPAPKAPKADKAPRVTGADSWVAYVVAAGDAGVTLAEVRRHMGWDPKRAVVMKDFRASFAKRGYQLAETKDGRAIVFSAAPAQMAFAA